MSTWREARKNVKTLESSPDFRHTAVKNDWTLDWFLQKTTKTENFMTYTEEMLLLLHLYDVA